MADADWSLVYPADGVYPGSSISWGKKIPIWNITTPELGDPEFSIADAPRARADGVDFGVDYIQGRTISFDIGVTGTTEADVRQNHANLARSWRADAVRSRPGAVAELHSTYRGIERVAFGRPRRYTPNLSEVGTARFAQVSADFQTADSVFYSAAQFYAGVTMSPALGGGFTAPFKAPITTSPSSDRSVTTRIDTDLPVWPVITITGGDITNPVVEVVGLWRIELLGQFAWDETITIDTQPWARTVLDSRGASLAGRISRSSTRLSKASIPSGTYDLALRGISTAKTSVATLRWRTAHATP